MKQRSKNIITSVLIALSFVLGFNASTHMADQQKQYEKKHKYVFDFTQFYEIYDLLESEYLYTESLDPEKLTYGAVKGMVNALEDNYTKFLDPDETQSFLTSLDGELEGIGVEIEQQGEIIVVVTPLKGTPADKAGVRPEDIIISVDGEDILGQDIYDVIKKIKGPRGTDVEIGLYRKKTDEKFEVIITRDKINIDSVKYTEKEGGIAYFNVFQFNPNTIKEFDAYVQEMVNKETKGIIVDLRFNGGGYLHTAVQLLSYFVPNNTNVVSIVYKDDSKNEYKYTKKNPILEGIPLVVLINKGSASASEIFAGAIQDLKLGVVIGETSFGKGTVQEVIELYDGSSIRYTVAKWLTPHGRDIAKKGIDPDTEVVFEIDEEDEKKDNQLEAALKVLKSN